MSARGVHFSEAARLSLRHSCLYVERNGQEPVSLPLEDINYLVLDTDQVTLSAALLAACAGQGCLVITCDSRHTPNGSLLPFHTFYRQHETVQAQLALSEPRKKRLWQRVVRAKIRNQATSLIRLGRDRKVAEKVAVLEQKVDSGDGGNVEAQAARLYFSAYTPGFLRDTGGDDRLNALLNYGYALTRAAVARDVAALGFIPCLGIHHKSMANAFNLADDLVEPWRPFVDVLAYEIFLRRMDEPLLTKEDRRELTSIFLTPVLFEHGETGLLQALRRQAEQTRGYYLGGGMPDFPDFLPGSNPCLRME